MRESGLALVDVPVVLARKVLNGTVPEPDDMGALLAAMLGALKARVSVPPPSASTAHIAARWPKGRRA